MARVLVVDDEPDVLKTLATLLGAEGYEVLTVAGGEEAMNALQSQEFNLMISDLRMSPVDGMQVLEFAHEKCPTMSVIMLTAYGQVETAIKSLELGAFDYIKKPFRTDELLQTVQKALEFHQYMKSPEQSG
jgi:DNA-binding NtrC family response regulator